MALWGKVNDAANKPKFLSEVLRNDQTVSDFDATEGIDVAAAQDSANIAKGITSPGWVKHRTYTDSNGNVRNKSEIIVAFGGDFE